MEEVANIGYGIYFFPWKEIFCYFSSPWYNILAQILNDRQSKYLIWSVLYVTTCYRIHHLYVWNVNNTRGRICYTFRNRFNFLLSFWTKQRSIANIETRMREISRTKDIEIWRFENVFARLYVFIWIRVQWLDHRGVKYFNLLVEKSVIEATTGPFHVSLYLV